MAGFRPYGGIYDNFGYDPRNDPMNVPAKNPLPQNEMSCDTGDAGKDGYSVLSRANRYDGSRPPIQGEPEYNGPRLDD